MVRRSAAGVNFGTPIMFWGDRMATLVDPDGCRWAFATNVADFDFAHAPALGFAAQA